MNSYKKISLILLSIVCFMPKAWAQDKDIVIRVRTSPAPVKATKETKAQSNEQSKAAAAQTEKDSSDEAQTYANSDSSLMLSSKAKAPNSRLMMAQSSKSEENKQDQEDQENDSSTLNLSDNLPSNVADIDRIKTVNGFDIPVQTLGQISNANDLPDFWQEQWNKTNIPLSSMSLFIKQINGPVILNINSQVPRNPASVMKTVTTWSALKLLGPDYQWTTRAYISGDKENPDLYIKGSGAPDFSYQNLQDLVAQVQALGITHIHNVVTDRSIFAPQTEDPNEFDNMGQRPYNAAPDALLSNLSSFALKFSPDRPNKTWNVALDPAVNPMPLVGGISWQDGGRCYRSKSALELTKQEDLPEGRVLRVKGSLSPSCGAFTVYRLIVPGFGAFERMFNLAWKQNPKASMTGQFIDGTVPVGAWAVAQINSKPYSQIIHDINKFSNNVMTKNVLLSLTSIIYPWLPANYDLGDNVVLAFLRYQGVDTHGFVISNGSGLSRQARVTALGLSQLFQRIWDDSTKNIFINSLPIIGLDGTLAHRLKYPQFIGKVQAKTGTLDNSRALAGFVQANNGHEYIVISIVNDNAPAAATSFTDAMLAWLIQQKN